ncbi:MAG: hypothetical protein QXV32_06255 [Conexivisphaerales archaeon]
MSSQISSLNQKVNQLTQSNSGSGTSFQPYEKLGVNTQYATNVNSCTSPLVAPCWSVNLGGQNTGSAGVTIIQIHVNGVAVQNDYVTVLQPAGANLFKGIVVPSGQTFQLSITLDSSGVALGGGHSFSSCQTIQVTLIIAAGNNYLASMVLL